MRSLSATNTFRALFHMKHGKSRHNEPLPRSHSKPPLLAQHLLGYRNPQSLPRFDKGSTLNQTRTLPHPNRGSAGRRWHSKSLHWRMSVLLLTNFYSNQRAHAIDHRQKLFLLQLLGARRRQTFRPILQLNYSNTPVLSHSTALHQETVVSASAYGWTSRGLEASFV